MEKSIPAMPLHHFSDVYGCDVYGADAYNEGQCQDSIGVPDTGFAPNLMRDPPLMLGGLLLIVIALGLMVASTLSRRRRRKASARNDR